MKMTPDQLRDSYIRFFEARGHRHVPSSPVIPEGDPTLLFTNAGMNQFKDVLLGRERRDYSRAVNAQKCIRAGGKHNDLDEVGRDGRHLTFFEMLGNWSFGDYYKHDAIRWAWDYVTTELGLDRSRLYVSVYKDDDESWDIWHRDVGVPADHIVRLGDVEQGDEENFWSMGPTGPCGPCTEIYYDHHPEHGAVPWEPGFDDERFLEIWNLVFMEFDRAEDGSLSPLPMKSVDTGMGLDRVAAVIEGVDNVFHTPIFAGILENIERLRTGEDVPAGHARQLISRDDFTTYCVIADHIRTLTFSICDGGTFSNEGRGYVLRRILRRAVRFGRNLGFNGPFLCRLVPAVVESFGHVYPELRLKQREAATILENEEARFFRTLDRGIALFEDVAAQAVATDARTIAGDVVFKLYDTFGFPIDLTEIMAEEKGLAVDRDGYERAMNEQRERSRSADDRYQDAGEWTTLIEGAADRFVGYDRHTAETRVLRFRQGPNSDVVEVCLQESPFYAESGGQVGDTGTLTFRDSGLVLAVHDTQRTTAGITLFCRVQDGVLGPDTTTGPVDATVDLERRRLISYNHTATHLLHAALHRFVSDKAFQAGSLVAPDRLRFDFSHDGPVRREQLDEIEAWVNARIQENTALSILTDVPLPEAEAMGAMMIFGEKYGERVRVVTIPGTSAELCGGIHAPDTASIGWFRIVSESGVAAGVRRIEAVTNQGAYQLAGEERAIVERLASRLRVPAHQLEERIQRMQEDRRDLERQIDALTRQQAGDLASRLVDSTEPVGPARLLAERVDVPDRDALLQLADSVRDRLADTVVGLLCAVIDDKPAVVVLVAEALTRSHGVKAGDLVNIAAAAVGGRGGGRPTLAQAGGSDVAGIPDAIARFRAAATERLGG